MGQYVEKAREAVAQVNKVILGKEKAVEEIMTAFLANGHVLLEDIPGVGKTTLALAFSKAMELECKRVQFTPDVMPSDLTGFSIYRKEEEKFVYQAGSVFCNLLLADEINRTSPKTQSALLEVMEERKVSVEGVTREVPKPFLVIATQNPLGNAGTQSLPEAQVDRFMISLTLGYPDFDSELSMAKSITNADRLDLVEPVIEREQLLEMQKDIHNVYIKDEVYSYIVNLVVATRKHPSLDRGASPRATNALVRMSKSAAWLSGREYVTPNDVCGQFPYVVTHRVTSNMAAKMDNTSKWEIVEGIIREVRKPPLGVL
ncbi:MAG: MoxR family ATPase [Clostridiales bacterium]|nr:MoxR family ATPase [Clostridiales bacterium]MDR2750297.1 MoxR family ATPase [Clostridiales bacterium]